MKHLVNNTYKAFFIFEIFQLVRDYVIKIVFYFFVNNSSTS